MEIWRRISVMYSNLITVSIPRAYFMELSDSESSGTSFLSFTVKNFMSRSSLSRFMRKIMPVLRSY